MGADPTTADGVASEEAYYGHITAKKHMDIVLKCLQEARDELQGFLVDMKHVHRLVKSCRIILHDIEEDLDGSWIPPQFTEEEMEEINRRRDLKHDMLNCDGPWDDGEEE